MCFKKKAPAPAPTPTPAPITPEQIVEQQQAQAEEVKQEEIAATREQKTADIQAEAPLTQEQIKLGRRGGTGRRTLLVSGAGGAGYLNRFGPVMSRLWG
jgi:hypothetical protein